MTEKTKHNLFFLLGDANVPDETHFVYEFKG